MTETYRRLAGGLAAALLLGLAGLFGGGTVAAQQPEGPPHQFDGTVTVDGAPAEAGTSVVAVVEGRECGAATVTTGARGSTYALHVPTSCATEGETVHFRIGGHVAKETATYAGGTRTGLDLTADMGEMPDDGDGDDGDMGDGDEPDEPDTGDGDEPDEPDMGDGDEPSEPGDDMGDGDMGDGHDGDDIDDPMVGDTGSGLTGVSGASLAAVLGALALALALGATSFARRR